MSYEKSKRLLNEHGLLTKDTEPHIKYKFNRIVSSNKISESYLHYITKCVIGKVIRELGDDYFCEFKCPCNREIDILQVKGKSLIGYEVESKRNIKRDVNGIDFITVYIKNIPKDLKSLHEYIKEKIVV